MQPAIFSKSTCPSLYNTIPTNKPTRSYCPKDNATSTARHNRQNETNPPQKGSALQINTNPLLSLSHLKHYLHANKNTKARGSHERHSLERSQHTYAQPFR